MTETPPIVEFITARYDEVERAALAAADEASCIAVSSGDEDDGCPRWRVIEGGEGITTEKAYADAAFLATPPGYLAAKVAEHVVRHDPAAVLADLAAKRAIVAKCLEQLANPHGAPIGRYLARDTLKLLADPYAGHPDFRADWRVTE